MSFILIPNAAAFFAYLLLTAFTPGPNNIMALSNAGAYGFKRAFRFCLGVFLGFLVVMSACALAGSLIYTAIPRLEPVLRWVGAAYILLLAWWIYRDPGDGLQARRLARPDGLLTGLVMQLINVKVIIYGLTALSVFVLPHQSQPGRLAVFVLLLSLMGLAGTLAWAGGGALMRTIFDRHRRLVNTILALSLVLCAVSTVIN